jgi:toxin YoeB
MKVTFEEGIFDTFNEWLIEDRRVYIKIAKLIKEIQRTPFTGTGKPEPLKHELSGYWSRRITEEHRLIYKIESDSVIVASCKGHYED